MERYAIRRFEPGAAFRFGCVIGAILLVVPGIATGLAVHSFVVFLLGWLDEWPVWNIMVLGHSVYEIHLLESLQLDASTAMLQGLAERGALVITAAIAAGIIALGGLWSGLSAAISALIYNGLAALSGGLVVRAEKLSALPALPPAPPVAMPLQPGVWLVAAANPAQRWPLQPGVTTVGSAADNQTVLGGLAPHHAEIRLENGRYILHDLSGGQTWVNNRQIAGVNMLKDGFTIRLGMHEFIFQHR